MNVCERDIKCCGCSACETVCSKGAISMEKDEKGFLKAIVNKEKCIDCSICVKVCPQNDYVDKMPSKYHIIGYSTDNDVRQISRSGGFFAMAADYILQNGGVVYGVIFDDELNVIYGRTEKRADIKRFQGSKYTQSYIGDTFDKVIEDLRNEKTVLFSGTACYVAGLLRALKFKNVPIDKLLTCDIICHGVISQKVYHDYIDWIERKYRGKVQEFNFRDKTQVGWAPHIESAVVNGKKIYKKHYTEMFYCGAANNESCYECRYTSVNRISDFTLADAWGVQEKMPEMFDNKGVSIVFINTNAAKELFSHIEKGFKYRKIDIKDFMQPQMRAPIAKSDDCDLFWNTYQTKGFKAVLKKWGKNNFADNLKRSIRWRFIDKYRF